MIVSERLRKAVRVSVRKPVLDRVSGKRNRNLYRPHFPLTPSDAAFTSTTLSATEYKVSGGELKVSRQVGLSRNPHARRSKPKIASSRLLLCRHSRATGFLLRVHGRCHCLRDSHLSWVCWLCLFCLSCAISSANYCLLRYFLRTATVVARKKITGDELNARAKET